MNQIDRKEQSNVSLDIIQDNFKKSRKKLSKDIHERSWLIKGHPLGIAFPISWKLGANILGDSFIKKTPLEGGTSQEALSYYISLFPQLIKFAEDQQLRYPVLKKFEDVRVSFFKGIQEAFEIDQGIQNLISQAYQDGGFTEEKALILIQNFVDQLHAKFLEKKKLLIYSGWKDRNKEGHALMLLLDLDNAKVTVVNTGSGLDNHPAATFYKINPLTNKAVKETRYQQIVTYRVDRKCLQEKAFLQVLIESKVRPVWDGLLTLESDVIYAPIKNLLKGKREAALNPNAYREVYRKDQKSGTCATRCVAATYYYHLILGNDLLHSPHYDPEGVDCYKLEKFLWQTQVLLKLSSDLRKMNEIQKAFMNEFVENTARSVLKSPLQDVLQPDDFVDLEATFQDIQRRLSLREDSFEVISPIDARTKIDSTTYRYSIAVPIPPPLRQLTDQEPGIDSTYLTINQLGEISTPYWRNAEELLQQLDRVNGFLKQIVENKPSSFLQGLIMENLKPFVLSLPVPNKTSTCIWENLEKKQVVLFMEKNLGLMKGILHLRKDFPGLGRQHSPEQTVMMYLLYMINVHLAKSLPESLLDGIKFSCKDLIWHVRSPKFVVEDARVQIKLLEIIRYFKPKFTLNWLVSKNKPIPLGLFDIQQEPKELKALFSFKTIKGKHAQVISRDNTHSDDQTLLLLNRHLTRILAEPSLREKLYKKQNPVSEAPLQAQNNQMEHLGTLLAEPFDASAYASALLPESVHLLKQSSLATQLLLYSSVEPKDIAPTVAKNSERLEFSSVGLGDFQYNHVIDDKLDGADVHHEVSIVLKELRNQNESIANQNIFLGQPLEICRELEMLGHDPYETIARCIGFMKNHPVLLENYEIRNLLWMHIFSPGRLLSQLKSDSSLFKTFNDMLIMLIKHSIEANQLSVSLFLIKLGLRLKSFTAQTNSTLRWADFREMMLSHIIPKLAKSRSGRARCYQALASAHKFLLSNAVEFNQNNAVDLIRILLCSRIHLGEVSDALRLMPSLSKYLKALHEQERDNILNDSLSAFAPLRKHFQWEEDPEREGCYRCEEYSINLKEGLYVDLKSQCKPTQLPVDFYLSYSSTDLKLKIDSVDLDSSNDYLINRGHPHEFIIRITDAKEKEERYQFSKRFQGKEYRLLPFTGQLSQYLDLKGDDALIWMLADSPSSLIITKGSECKPNRFIVLQKESRDDKEQDLESYSIKRIYSYDYEGNIIRSKFRVPLKHISPHLHFFETIEEPNQIECWVDATETLFEIKLSKLGLSFNVKIKDGTHRFYCSNYPGYYLIKNPEIEGLKGWPHFLTLVNASGDQKILIPHKELFYKYLKSFDYQIGACREGSKVEILDQEHDLLEKERDSLKSKRSNNATTQYHDLLKDSDLLVKMIKIAKESHNERLKTVDLSMRRLERLKNNLAPIPIPDLDIDKRIPLRTFHLKGWSEYQIQKGDERLKSPTLDGQLYLFYLYVIQADFNRAYEQLKSLNPLERVVDDERKNKQQLTFSRLIIKTLTENEHPTARALFLHFICFCSSNLCRYPLDDYTNWQELILWQPLYRIFDSYQKSKINTPIRLSSFEEQEIIEILLEKFNYHIPNLRGSLLEEAKEAKRCTLEWKSFLSAKQIPVGSRVFEKISLHFPAYGFSHNTTLDSNFELSIFLIQKRNYFEEHFFNLYEIARVGDAAKKAKLKTILNAANYSDIHIQILKQVLVAPFLYPKRSGDISGDKFRDSLSSRANLIEPFYFLSDSIVTLGHFLHGGISSLLPGKKTTVPSQESFQSKLLHYSNESLLEIDQEYDGLFKSLVSKFFDSKTVRVKKEKDLLPTDDPDESVRERLKEENVELAFFRNQLPSEKKVYSLKTATALDELSAFLENQSLSLSGKLKAQKAALIWQINDIPLNSEQRSLKQIRKIAFREKLSWNEIRKLALERDLKGFLKKTYLKENEATLLLQGVSEYLVTSTRLNQMKAVLVQIGKVNKKQNLDLKQALLQYVLSLLLSVRAYVPSDSTIARQLFENANQYHYRELQLKKIQEVMERDEKILMMEMPTGTGKTKTITASLNQLKGEEEIPIFNTFPGSVEMQNAHDIQEQYQESYGRKVDRLFFDRLSIFTEELLGRRYQDIVRDIKLKRPIIMKSESFRALELHTLLYIKEALKSFSRQYELTVSIGYLLKILRLARVEGWSSIDESHSTLDAIDELIYSLGIAEQLPEYQVDLVEEIFLLLTEGELSKLLNIENNQQQHALPIYEKKVAKPLINHFIERFAISSEQHTIFKQFILGTTDEIPAFLENHPQKKEILLLRGLLSEVLKTSLKGSVDETFGLSKLHISKKEFPIPFFSANRPKENGKVPSQYKNPHVTLAKTYITYLFKGLSKKQVVKWVEFLKNQALKEVELGIAFQNTKAFKLFNEHVKGISLISFDAEKDSRSLYKQIRKSKPVIFHYIRNIIVPQIKIYPEEICSTVLDFLSQFDSSLSLSANPQDPMSLNLDTFFIPMRGTSGQVTHLLLSKCKDPSTIHRQLKIKPKEVLEEALEIQRERLGFHATIDVGALTKGMSNGEITERLCREFAGSDQIKGIVSFDDENTEMFYMTPTHHGDDEECSSETTYAFFDQSRTEASDVPLPKGSKGFLITKAGQSKSAVGQGAGRMRELDREQTVEVSYPALSHEEIFGKDSKNIKKLLTYWIKNDLKMRAEKNYEYQIRLMKNLIRRAVWDAMLGINHSKEPNVGFAIDLVNWNKWVFFSSQTADPEILYLKNQKEKDTIECLNEFKIKIEQQIEQLQGLSAKEKTQILNQLNRFPSLWPKMTLPKMSKPTIGTRGECEVLQEVEVRSEIQAQTHVKQNIATYDVIPWLKDIDIFKEGWENQFFLTSPIQRIAERIFSLIPIPIETLKDLKNFRKVNQFIALIAFGSLASSRFSKRISDNYAVVFTLSLIIIGTLSILFSKANIKISPMRRFMRLNLPRKVKSASQIFSPNFFVSNNFYHQGQSPFDLSQKPLYSVLVLLDEDPSGKSFRIKMMAMDQNDSKFFHQKLLEDSTTELETAKKRRRMVGIYDLATNRFIAQGKNKFLKSDMKHPAFARLTAQAKFLNGSVQYTEQERQELRKHFEQLDKTIGKKTISALFYNYILPNYPKNLRFAKNFDLGLGIGRNE